MLLWNRAVYHPVGSKDFIDIANVIARFLKPNDFHQQVGVILRELIPDGGVSRSAIVRG
jgi:hypothetical protein